MKNIFSRFTLRTLHQNKVRTLVTIIGIALSVAMFTAVTSIVVSFQNYMIDIEVKSVGAWEGWLEYGTEAEVDDLRGEREIRKSTKVADLGHALAEGCTNEAKPYVHMLGIEENFEKLVAVNLSEGRMPENDTEIVIPRHLWVNGNVEWKVGDTVTLNVGQRASKKDQTATYSPLVPYSGQETLVHTQEKTYTVVGICDRMSIEDYSAPGYTVLTRDSGTKAAAYDLFVTFHHPKKAEDILSYYAKQGSFTTHRSLLRYQGNSLNSRMNSMLYSMAGILMIVIMVGSISLIYNSFSISVSERTKQFGLLKSIGATKRQIRHSVLFEAFYLSLFGIPLGILAGLGGIGITLHFIGGLLNKTWGGDVQGDMTLHVTWWSLAVAVLISLVTVLISAMIPARRAMKRSAIDSIRQSGDIRIRPGEVRTSGLTYRLFGFEAMVASKNFKRNRKKYRATVFSLFISIVLFVTAASFTGYLKSTVKLGQSHSNYDVEFGLDSGMSHSEDEQDQEKAAKALDIKKNPEKVGDALRNMDGVQEVGFAASQTGTMDIPLEYLNEEFLSKARRYYPDCIDEKRKVYKMNISVHFVEDESYRRYLEGCKGLRGKEEDYLNMEDGACLLWDQVLNVFDGKYFSAHALKKTGWTGTLHILKTTWEMSLVSWDGDQYTLEDYSGDEPEQKVYPVNEVCVSKKVIIKDTTDGIFPLGVSGGDGDFLQGIHMVLPYSGIKQFGLWQGDEMEQWINFHIRTKEHEKIYKTLMENASDVLPGLELVNTSVYDQASSFESEQALVAVIDIFAYGFIALISLISIANVFNTISTNFQLRRQEFAMLKSVGMTQKGFRRMMNYECILYGLKGLLAGLPVSILISWFMYRAMQAEWNAAMMIPWKGILTACICVFAVVFATMLYSMSRLRKENIIDGLRNENL